MWKNTKPTHLAFETHDRHVVTCLQFDDDKIIAGSDNTKINVYDTPKPEHFEQYSKATKVAYGALNTMAILWSLHRQIAPSEYGTLREPSAPMCSKVTHPQYGSYRYYYQFKLTSIRTATRSISPPAESDEECPYLIRVLTGHQHSVRAVAAHGDTLVSGSYDCTVRVWKISTGESLHQLQGHTMKIYSVSLDHKRNRCISGSMDHVVKIWSLDTGALLYNLEGHTSLVGLLDLKEDILVSAAADATLRVWDPENGHCQSVLSGHTGAITSFQHDGQKIISGSDMNVKMWDARTGVFERDLFTDLSGVWQVQFDAQRCVAAVQRGGETYIEILDFGTSSDAIPSDRLGRRVLVDELGDEIESPKGDVDLSD
ncbi:hypothetical protein HAV15_004438 [Penicillium sp. str. |nr:hypothetical protein HAV15_004438 [Penicillium sp. str. \